MGPVLDNGLGQGEVENVSKDISQLLCTGLEHSARNAIRASRFVCFHPAQSGHTSLLESVSSGRWVILAFCVAFLAVGVLFDGF